jgi:hypothetical protein
MQLSLVLICVQQK